MPRDKEPEKDTKAASRHGVGVEPLVGRSFEDLCDEVRATDEERAELEAQLYLIRLRGRLAFRRHLSQCAEQVRQWPKWKQRAL